MQIKAQVVAEDEREAGKRAWLNFGHTFAHAIEHVAGYGTVAHGEAVALGMRAALYMSHRRAPAALDHERLDALLAQLPTPNVSHLDFDALWRAMRHDKKTKDGAIRFVLLHAVGDPFIADDCSRTSAQRAWDFVQQSTAQHAS